MEQGDVEQLAESFRRMAGVGVDEVRPVTRMVIAVLGPDALAIDEPGAPARLEGRRVWVAANDPDPYFSIAHEVGEWLLRDVVGYAGRGEPKERLANRIAGAILAPRHLLLRVHGRLGERPRAIGRVFVLSQTAVVLRLAEVLGDRRAVVTRSGHVLARGEGWERVPAVDVARGRVSLPGLAKARLRGGIDDGRVALRER